jgi:hypothetical protein
MRKSNLARFTTSIFLALALFVGVPSSALADEISITSTSITTSTGDPSEVNFWGNTWTLSLCSKSKAAKKASIQVKSGKKWKKLSKVSKAKTVQDVSQCLETHPYLTEFTYAETKVGEKKYRVYIPGKSGYKTNFVVAMNSSTTAVGVAPNVTSPSKLKDCYFKGKKLAGSVYFSNSQYGSDFTIYESSTSIGSDLGVYLYPSNWAGVNPRTIATCGQWIAASTSSSLDADFIVYKTSSPASADFVINYVPFAWNAGLN